MMVSFFPSPEPLYNLFLSALYFTPRSSCTFTEGQSRDKDSEDRLGTYTQHGAPLVWELMLSAGGSVEEWSPIDKDFKVSKKMEGAFENQK